MKNLSYSISLLTIAILVAYSCNRNNQNLGRESMGAEIHSVDKESIMDTTKLEQESNMSAESGSRRDSLNKEAKYAKKSKKDAKEAPKNEAPNQAEIDSLKKAKEKAKKP